ncbi:DNA internalization-related competence protein ComEC/Rec2 [Ideonella sp.]|uniref:DNA internalization-related competence protein ComEC/Rec2 n=1 Tax=Ideonella sp. TaxID=1929293 RepID=UPI0035B28DC1
MQGGGADSSAAGGWVAALAAAWLAGTALQLQQAHAWTAGAYAALAGVAVAGLAVAGLMAGLNAGLTAGPPRAASRATGCRALALAGVAVLAFSLAGWRGAERLADRLDPALEGADLVVTGRVVGLPQPGPEGSVLLLDTEHARGPDGQEVAVPSRVRLGWSRPREGASGVQGAVARAGERWQLPVRLKQPHGVLNPEGFDAELWLFEQGIGATGSVRASAPQALARLDGPRAWHPRDRLDAARQGWRDAALLHGADPVAAGVVAALAVGDQSAIEAPAWAVFRQTGVAHLMSISGLHVTLFAWLAAGVVSRLWRRSARLAHAWPAPQAARWGGVALAAAYAALAGWGVPAQRTVWMLAGTALVQGSGLRWPPLLVCAVAGAGVAALDPWALLQPGFWLSFTAVALLIASQATFGHGSAPAGPRARARGWLRAGLHQQVVATLALAPLTLVMFEQISVVGFGANLVAVPWVTAVVTPLALLGLLWPGAWTLAGWALAPLWQGLQAAAGWPWAVWSVPAAPGWAAALGLAGGVLLVLPLPWRARLAGLPLLLPLLWPAVERPAPGRFELVVADVGQGSAVLVRTAHHLLLHDTGPRYGLDSDAGERVLLPLMRARGERRIDALVISHRDTDHAGGAAAVLQAMAVQEVLSSLEPAHPLRAARGPGGRAVPHRPCEAGQAWSWDGVRFEVLHPPPGPAAASPAGREPAPNTRSCVVRVVDGAGRAVLLTGDIEAAQEQWLAGPANAAHDLRADVLIVPHHGSRTSSTDALLAAVRPRVAVLQAGYRNRYGHPHPTVLARYAALGIPVVRTDQCGAWMWSDDGARCTREVRRRYWHWRPAAEPPEGGAVVAIPHTRRAE